VEVISETELIQISAGKWRKENWKKDFREKVAWVEKPKAKKNEAIAEHWQQEGRAPIN